MTDRRQQTRERPTEDIRRYRGDWLLEALVAIHKAEFPWKPVNDKPSGLSSPFLGRFDVTKGVWDTMAGEQSAAPPPLEGLVVIPPAEEIDYAGEHVTVNPTYVRTLHNHMRLHRLLTTFQQYATDQRRPAVASYWPSRKKVCWGNTTTRAQRSLVKLLSDEVPYQPLTEDAKVTHHA